MIFKKLYICHLMWVGVSFFTFFIFLKLRNFLILYFSLILNLKYNQISHKQLWYTLDSHLHNKYLFIHQIHLNNRGDIHWFHTGYSHHTPGIHRCITQHHRITINLNHIIPPYILLWSYNNHYYCI